MEVHSLSIHPPYVEEIQLGYKTFELRKYNPRIHRGSWVAIYETKPTMAITTVFQAGNTLVEEPQWFWDNHHCSLGIDKEAYFEYFKGKTTIFALEINTLPGLTDTSLLPKATMSIGMSYRETICKIIDLSYKG